ncbi:BACON domain-containing protein [Sphingobacterium deserti]|uniref:Lipoprotein n=1 Tax=Sphingobacterium deserti TaxID=1229276 RepID=A0A0B8T3D7_9SPHI|nr:BACON domain-containing protein [Sphingobacterium deserti]KGE13553.1 hypothetical protein DI53_2614 [Sphingobacterium deserti]
MKGLTYTILLIFFASLFFSSCKKLDGIGIAPGFDSGPHLFTHEIKDTILISKNNIKWSLDRITVDGIDDYILEKNNHLKYYRKEANPNSDSNLGEIYKIENNWFVIEKMDDKHIHVLLKENNVEKERTFTITCFAGNANTKITVIQKNK